jgi:hypothetical protein
MPIDPKVEESARDLLGHAIRGEFDESANVIEAVGEQRFLEAGSLCLRIAGYIAIDVCAWQWPTDADLREIAQRMAGMDAEFELDESDVYDYLTRAALGFEPLLEVFPDKEKAATVPFFATATLLVAYRPDDQHWWEYLDEIEQALETAAPLPEKVVPALLLLSRRNRALKAKAEANGAAEAGA